jgi:hypothetical protein
MRNLRRFGAMVPFGVVAMMILLTGAEVWSQKAGQTSTRTSMRGLFVVISNLYRYSLDAAVFADPKNHEEIASKLDALVQNTEQLETHGESLDPSFDFMKRSLARDAHEARDNFKSANYIGSRFVLSDITENCVTCHTKLPAERTFEEGREFLAAIEADKFPPSSRAKLQVASRQFSDAAATYETILRSQQFSADDLTVFNVFDNYLSVCVGSLNDPKRPIPVLEAFAGRSDVPANTKEDAQAWIASLEALDFGAVKGKELATARTLVENASDSAADRAHLVDYIAASSLVHRFLRSGPQSNETTSEAYYLLGVAESNVSRSYWVFETEHLLDKSIRLAPKTKVAKQALAYLENYRRTSSTATPARVIPKEMQVNIDELRKLTGS